MKQDEIQQNLNLAFDMICYLAKIITKDQPNKIDTVTELVEKWDSGVTEKLRQILVEDADQLSKHTGDPADIAAILISIEQQHDFAIKDDFKKMIRNLIIYTITEDINEKQSS